jgi:hypothetical protein
MNDASSERLQKIFSIAIDCRERTRRIPRSPGVTSITTRAGNTKTRYAPMPTCKPMRRDDSNRHALSVRP